MIPASFEYSSPNTLAEAISLLQQHRADAKILSGGQSLTPLMNLRMAAPKHVVDINGGILMDYLTCTPSPHHPIGAKGVGESAAIANAVVDALWHLGVRHVDIPITPPKVWALVNEKGVAE